MTHITNVQCKCSIIPRKKEKERKKKKKEEQKKKYIILSNIILFISTFAIYIFEDVY
jgi:hypothetical protein